MTTHKDRPHDTDCAMQYCGSPCTCDGTRWYNFGASIEDSIAIQGIATFFARLQTAEFYYHPIDFDIYPNNGGIETLLSPLYANPVTPAAHPVTSHGTTLVSPEESRTVQALRARIVELEAAQTVAVPDGEDDDDLFADVRKALLVLNSMLRNRNLSAGATVAEQLIDRLDIAITKESGIWHRFPGWLIDNYEGHVVSEEMLQSALADLLSSAPATPAKVSE